MNVKIQALILKHQRYLYLAGNEEKSFYLVSELPLTTNYCYDLKIRFINFRFDYGYLIQINSQIYQDISVNPHNISLIVNELIKC